MSRKDAQVNDYALRMAIIRGSLKMCQLLVNFQLIQKDTSLFSLAVRCGKLEICQWLANQGHFTPQDIAANNCEILCLASRCGNSKLCQWLVSHFQMTLQHESFKAVFRGAVDVGALGLCRWLVSHFNPTFSQSELLCLFTLAVHHHYDDLIVCKWLVAKYPITIEHDVGVKMVKEMERSALYETSQWLMNTFKFSIPTQ